MKIEVTRRAHKETVRGSMTMTQFLIAGAGVFACGAVYEGLGIMWVHWAERNCPFHVGVISAVQACCSLTGIGASLADYTYAPFFIGGYFLGPYVVVAIKRRQKWQ